MWFSQICFKFVKFSTIFLCLFVFVFVMKLYLEHYALDRRPRAFIDLGYVLDDFQIRPVRRHKLFHVCMDKYQGGLGNRMFQYAAVYVSASKFNKTVKLSTHDALRLPFDIKATHSYFFRCRGRILSERLPCAFDDRLLHTSPDDQNVELHGYWQSWKYFRHYELDLRREFQFKGDILRRTHFYLEQLRNFTLIGIHMRRGDMLSKNSLEYGYQLPKANYFFKAMSWFRKRFPDAVFIVCSNDMHYAKSILTRQKDVFFSENKSPEEDLSILASCEHVIMSVGTFGWWGGWLAGGQVIYFRNYSRKGSKFEKDLVPEDFFPPTWIGMD